MRQPSPLPLVSVGKAVAGTVIIAVLPCHLAHRSGARSCLPPAAGRLCGRAARLGRWRGGGGGVGAIAVSRAPAEGVALLVFLLAVGLGHDAGMGLAERLAVPAQSCGHGRRAAGGSGRLRRDPVARARSHLTVFKQDGIRLHHQRRGRSTRRWGMSAATIDAMSGQLRQLVDVVRLPRPWVPGHGAVLVAGVPRGAGVPDLPAAAQE